MPLKPIAYLDGLTTGHLDWPPTIGAAGQPTVLINGRPVAYNTAVYVTHVNSKGVPHPSPTAIGTGTVTVYGQPICRVGDFLSCGDMIINGCPSVLAGP